MLTFNISILYNVINILVLFVLLKIFLFKPVTEIMEKRKAMIQQDLDDAKKAKDDAEQMKGEYENTLNSAKNQAADIVKDAKTRAEVEYNSIIEQGNKDAAAIMANADKTIAQEKERAIKQRTALEICRYRFFLSNHALVQCFFQFLQTGCLAFCQTADRNLCPSSHHIGNLIFAHHRNFVFGYAAVFFFEFFPGCLQVLPRLFRCAGFLHISRECMFHIQFRLMNLTTV